MAWPADQLPDYKIARLYNKEGMEALAGAHPLWSQQDLLVTHLFPKLTWGAKIAMQRVCVKWRLWWRMRNYAYTLPFLGPSAVVNTWILNDLVFNDGRDFHAWINKDMTVYFDGFPLLFKDEE